MKLKQMSKSLNVLFLNSMLTVLRYKVLIIIGLSELFIKKYTKNFSRNHLNVLNNLAHNDCYNIFMHAPVHVLKEHCL